MKDYTSVLFAKKENSAFGAADIDTDVQELTYLLIEETCLDVGGNGGLVKKGNSTLAKMLKQMQR